MSSNTTDVSATTKVMKDVIGLMQRIGGTVGVTEATTGTNATRQGGQGSKTIWIGIGTVLSSNTAGTQE
jgi:hypothetical protein